MIKLIVGLGNPGAEYEITRHNCGFLALERIAKKLEFSEFKTEKKSNAESAVGKIRGKKILLLKPMTFMNKSGEAVAAAARYYKIKPAEILVVHDDKDIAFGEFKLQRNRSSAGHKGVESVMRLLKTEDFYRARLGTALKSRARMGDTGNFVLKKFKPDELKILNKTVDGLIERLEQNEL